MIKKLFERATVFVCLFVYFLFVCLFLKRRRRRAIKKLFERATVQKDFFGPRCEPFEMKAFISPETAFAKS